MNNERDNKEWLNEYPELSKVNPANAFKVPVNYFEETEGRIMAQLSLTELLKAHPQGGFATPANYFDELSNNIQSRVAIDAVINDKGFTVPEGYFDELSNNINSRIAIGELMDTDKGFTVPEGYFDELSSNITSRIAIDELLNTEKGFTVTQNYFEELSQNIEARIAVEELISEDHGFTVPANYFEGLEARILAETVGTSAPAKQNKPLVRKLWSTEIFKYATAACFALFVGAAILTSEFNETAIHNRSDIHKALSGISKSDMENYLELSSDATTIMENVDATSLINKTAASANSNGELN